MARTDKVEPGDAAEARKSRIASDKALLTEEHDEIMQWLDDHMFDLLIGMKMRVHWEEIGRTIIIGVPPTPDQIRDMSNKAEQHVKKLRAEVESRKGQTGRVSDREQRFRQALRSWRGLGRPPKQDLLEITEIVWQEPVVLSASRTAYMDMKVSFRAHALTVEGMWDVEEMVVPSWCWVTKEFTFWIEVEPEIVSAGGLIRRLRQYEEALEGGSILVVSTDTSYSRLLREQGFFFLQYDPRRF